MNQWHTATSDSTWIRSLKVERNYNFKSQYLGTFDFSEAKPKKEEKLPKPKKVYFDPKELVL